MDQEIIRKYKERFELSADDDVPSVVAFKAMTEGTKKELQNKLDSTHRQISRNIELLDLKIEQPLPFELAKKERWSTQYFAAVWKEMVEAAHLDNDKEDISSKIRAGKYVLGLLHAALDSGTIKSTVGGWPSKFETPEIQEIEESYRRKKDQYPSEGLKFSAKNKGTLQLHLHWR